MRALIIAAMLLSVPSSASAILYRVDFTVKGDVHGDNTGQMDPLYNGEVVDGSFMFRLPADAVPESQDQWGTLYNFNADLGGLPPINVQFSWQGIDWDKNNTGIGLLAFDPDGNLETFLLFGGDHSGGGPPNFDFFVWPGYDPGFFYTNTYISYYPDPVSFWRGELLSWSYSVAPEPGTLALLGCGLLLWPRRKRKN